jgi:hypothetical protein
MRRFFKLHGWRWPACCWAAVLLSACGGGQSSTPVASQPHTSATSSRVTPQESDALLLKAAGLNSAELAQAAEQSNRNKSTARAVKAAVLGGPATVYRFFNAQTAAHFYTASEAERDAVLASSPQFRLEGPAFIVSSVPGAGLNPVHRFFNTQTGVHFYTISEDERAMIQTSLPQFSYDGIAYYASKVPGAQTIPLYRHYNIARGFHFYTSRSSERDSVINGLPQYRYEGIGYYVFTMLTLPHTGMTALQCFEAGLSPAAVNCSSARTIQFNSEQDGHRVAFNPMSYSEVPMAGGGTYPRTSCIRDDVTGLVWEGKEAAGPRSGGNVYTNYDDTTQPQKDGFPGPNVNPTLAEINAANNTVGYVGYVNGIALCGFTDWRLPTSDELHGVMDYSRTRPAVKLNTDWFVNAPSAPWAYHWTSDSGYAFPSIAWYVDFESGNISTINRYRELRLRLVRDGR